MGITFFSFEHLFLVFLASIGLSHIIIDGRIFHDWREWVKKTNVTINLYFVEINLPGLVLCYQCCGFWTGGLCYLMSIPLIISPVLLLDFVLSNIIASVLTTAIGFLLIGWASSYLCMFARTALDYFIYSIDIDITSLNKANDEKEDVEDGEDKVISE